MYKIKLNNIVYDVKYPYIAMDCDGDWYSYYNIPSINYNTAWFWDEEVDNVFLGHYNQVYIPWDKTLFDLPSIGCYGSTDSTWSHDIDRAIQDRVEVSIDA